VQVDSGLVDDFVCCINGAVSGQNLTTYKASTSVCK
jgi:hypothetical protein